MGYVRWKWLYWTCILWLSISFEIIWGVSLIVQYFTSINVSLTPLQCFLNLPTSNTDLSDSQTKDLCLLLLYAKQYHYACKTMQKKQEFDLPNLTPPIPFKKKNRADYGSILKLWASSNGIHETAYEVCSGWFLWRLSP